MEEKTPIAYIPVGVAGYSGQLRVQIVPGSVPCLVPAYLLTDLGSVIDMSSMRVYHTHYNCMQYMLQKSSGHVEVSLTEFGQRGFRVPSHVAFGKSQVWGERSSPTSPPTSFAIVDAAGLPLDMPPALAPLVAALAVGLLNTGHVGTHGDDPRASSSSRPTLGHSPRTYGTKSDAAATAGELHLGEGEGREAGADPELPAGRRRGPSSTSGSTYRAVEVPGTCAAIIADVPTRESVPRSKRSVGMGQVRAVRVCGADPQAHPGSDAGVEHSDGVSETDLRDPAGQEAGEATKEGHRSHQLEQTGRSGTHDDLDEIIAATTHEFCTGGAGPFKEFRTNVHRGGGGALHRLTSQFRVSTPEFGRRPGARLVGGHPEPHAMRPASRESQLHAMCKRRPQPLLSTRVSAADMGLSSRRPSMQVHLAGEDTSRADVTSLRSETMPGVPAERGEEGGLEGPRSMAVRPMWRSHPGQRVVGGPQCTTERGWLRSEETGLPAAP